MAGRILNRAARDRLRDGLITVASTSCTYEGLKAVMECAHIGLDAGVDTEAVRLACNNRRIELIEAKRKVRKMDELFS